MELAANASASSPESGSAWVRLNQTVLRRLLAHPRLWLCLLAAVLLLPGTGALPLMDRDEPRFARATIEMIQRGDAVIPWFNGDYRFDKPPLTYWWMALNYAVFGPTELGARLHSVLAALGVALVLHGLGKRLFSNAAGFWAGTAWLASFQVIAHGRLCVADMPMILFVAVGMWAMYELLAPEKESRPAAFWRNGWFWLLAISLGLGFLAKGPIALFVPLLSLLILRWALWRKPLGPAFRWGWLLTALGAALVMVALWGIPALIVSKGEFWYQGIGKHIYKRGVDSFNGRVPLPFFYFATAFVSLIPWLGRAGLAWSQTRSSWDFRRAFLLSWLIVPYLIFSFYATQLPHYVLPGLGAFFLLLFQDMGDDFPVISVGKMSRVWFWSVHVFWALLMGALLYVAALGKWPAPLNAVQGPVVQLVILLCALQLAALCCYGRQLLPALACLGLCACLLQQIGEEARGSNPALQVRQGLSAEAGLSSQFRMPADRRDFLAVRFTEPSLVFYQEGKWEFASNLGKAEKLLAKARKKGRMPAAVVMLEKEWTLSDHLPALLRPMDGGMLAPTDDYSAEVAQMTQELEPKRVQRIEGFNNGRTSWCQLVVMEL